MSTLIVVDHSGKEHELQAHAGQTVMEVTRDAGLTDMLALCGGCCSCATCHVHVDPAFVDRVTPMSADENELLEGSSQRDATSRLACQLRFSDDLAGLRVTIARED